MMYVQTSHHELQKSMSLLPQRLSQKVRIYFSIRHLFAQKVYLIIYQKLSNQNPKVFFKTNFQINKKGLFDFADSVQILYHFEERQKILVEVVDGEKLSQTKILGKLEIYLGQIVNGGKQGASKSIKNFHNQIGLMIFKVQKVNQQRQRFVSFQVSLMNLALKSCLCFYSERQAKYQIYKYKQDQQKQYILYKSKSLRKSQQISFQTLVIKQQKLCDYNHNQPIIFRVLSNSDRILGQVRTDLDALIRGRRVFEILYKNSINGVISINNFEKITKFSIFDYINAGMQIALVICIDFTASNLNKKDTKSLHYVTQDTKSSYQIALNETGAILLDYDTDKKVPLYGYGAIVDFPNYSSNNECDHCFPLNCNKQQPEVAGLDIAMQTYRKSLEYLKFSSPTYFSPLLKQAMIKSQKMKKETKQYMVLLILTDGQICDLQQVKDLIVKCAKLPLSIIIIGVGPGDQEYWQAMHDLDNNQLTMVDSKGNKAQRDLVTFVEFDRHGKNSNDNDGKKLAAEVLKQLPTHIDQYHRLVGLSPQSYRQNKQQ